VSPAVTILKEIITASTRITGDLANEEQNLDVCSPESEERALDRQAHLITEKIGAGPPETGLSSALNQLTDRRKTILEGTIARLNKLVEDVSAESAAPMNEESIVGSMEDAMAALGGLQSGARGLDQDAAALDLLQLMDSTSDFVAQLWETLNESQRAVLFDFLMKVRIGPKAANPRVVEPKAYIFRSAANLFGWSAPITQGALKDFMEEKCGIAPRQAKDYAKCLSELFTVVNPDGEFEHSFFLDGAFPRTGAGSPVGIRSTPGDDLFKPYETVSAAVGPRNVYGLRGNATRIDVGATWWPEGGKPQSDTELQAVLQGTRVLCDAEELELAEQPRQDPVGPASSIECDGVVPGLHAGRKVIIEGAELHAGVEASEPSRWLVDLVDVDHNIRREIFGDRFCTTIGFAPALPARLRRETVRIYANVIEASHGESTYEALGAGDAGHAFQHMALSRPELTHVPAPTPGGVEAALTVSVNDVPWSLCNDFESSGPAAEHFVPARDDQQRTSIQFGDGVTGARLPTGQDNVRAAYRAGLGRKGNVAAGRINLAVGAPLGVKKVINPLPSQGGADPDGLRQIRRRAPLAVTAMDRLVSAADFADFARNFAGIGKASAACLGGVVHVTVAGLDEAPLRPDSPVMRNLRHAMGIYGDPSQRFALHDREAALLILAANVRVDPRREWTKMEPALRAALLTKFSYDEAEFGQDALLSDAIQTLQSIDGVDYVDIDVFDVVNQSEINTIPARLTALVAKPRIHVLRERLAVRRAAPLTTRDELPEETPSRLSVCPGQVCFLPGDIPGALILMPIL
jgi:hypothetical protein